MSPIGFVLVPLLSSQAGTALDLHSPQEVEALPLVAVDRATLITNYIKSVRATVLRYLVLVSLRFPRMLNPLLKSTISRSLSELGSI